MMYGLARTLGFALARHPRISAGLIVGALILAIRSCSDWPSAHNESASPAQLHQAREAERVAAEAARLEAVKTPAQRASEAAEKQRKLEAEQRAAAAEAAKLAAREAAIAKAGKGLEHLPWWKLCARWGAERRSRMGSYAEEAALRALKNQNLINQRDEQSVAMRDKLPQVGMTGCGAIAVLGGDFHQNASTSASQTRVQMVFRSKGVYVYTAGPPGDHVGVITSISY